MTMHIIYLENGMLLWKKAYASWREIQDEYSTYKTSLGPCEIEEIVDYLSEDYPELSPPAREQVMSLISSSNDVWMLTFRERQ